MKSKTLNGWRVSGGKNFINYSKPFSYQRVDIYTNYFLKDKYYQVIIRTERGRLTTRRFKNKRNAITYAEGYVKKH